MILRKCFSIFRSLLFFVLLISVFFPSHTILRFHTMFISSSHFSSLPCWHCHPISFSLIHKLDSDLFYSSLFLPFWIQAHFLFFLLSICFLEQLNGSSQHPPGCLSLHFQKVVEFKKYIFQTLFHIVGSFSSLPFFAPFPFPGMGDSDRPAHLFGQA